jgi:hypothetical protein
MSIATSVISADQSVTVRGGIMLGKCWYLIKNRGAGNGESQLQSRLIPVKTEAVKYILIHEKLDGHLSKGISLNVKLKLKRLGES